MDRWSKKVAVVTGASSGIGAEIAKDLARVGVIVVGLARRVEKVEALKSDLGENVRENLHCLKCDIRSEEEIVSVFGKIIELFGGVDILINNAGVADNTFKLTDRGKSSTINDIIQTNIVGLINCTREAVSSMKERNFPGQIVHINSILGHQCVFPPPALSYMHFNVYPATKFAVTALTELYRQEMTRDNLGIKISSISPTVVATNLCEDLQPENMTNIPHLLPSDVSQAVLYILSTPPHVNVQDVILKAVGSRN
ncbi:farnesol dehydrogenase-like [Phlebotomus argentipes]|uniref:farnesol dehydrogenase-like n=1 Tax=Phlebotomus argentipes TaxID=94469 RepID=UPI002893085C|nr:farnesol dehydrogenase-like [Phlebotomus argentipes]